MNTVAAVFAIIDLIGHGLELAEDIGRIVGASDEDLAAIRAEVTKRRNAANDAMQETT